MYDTPSPSPHGMDWAWRLSQLCGVMLCRGRHPHVLCTPKTRHPCTIVFQVFAFLLGLGFFLSYLVLWLSDLDFYPNSFLSGRARFGGLESRTAPRERGRSACFNPTTCLPRVQCCKIVAGEYVGCNTDVSHLRPCQKKNNNICGCLHANNHGPLAQDHPVFFPTHAQNSPTSVSDSPSPCMPAMLGGVQGCSHKLHSEVKKNGPKLKSSNILLQGSFGGKTHFPPESSKERRSMQVKIPTIKQPALFITYLMK